MHFTPAAVVAGLLLRPVIATFEYGGWGGDSSYSTPDNTNNKCSTDQAKGYDWADLSPGSFDSYGSNKFSKWSCTNSFGKRDLLTKRTFQSKCISSNLDDEPSIGCNGDDSMSIDKYEVSSSQDTDIECHYQMPDNTVCTEYHSCKSGGTVIQNSQCGGAKSVTFKPAQGYQGKGCNIGVHSIGFNCGAASSTIPAYASSTPASYITTSVASSTESVSTSSAVEITTDTSAYTSPLSTSTEVVPSYGSSTEEVPSYGSTTVTAASSVVSTESVPTYDTTLSTTTSSEVLSTSSASSETAPAETTSPSATSYETSTCLEGYGSSCSSAVASSSESGTSSATSATSRETSPVETSSVTDTTTTSAAPSIPAYQSHNASTSGAASSYNTSLTYSIPAYPHSSTAAVEVSITGTISSYATSTIYSTACETFTSSGSVTTLTKSYAVSTTVAAVTSPGKDSSPVGTASPSAASYSGPAPSSPALLPRCLNTWLYLTDCTSNSDSTCYCKDSDFINKVYGCLSAWSQSADNATNGVSYLMGLCAPYIPQNPAIITGCPVTITPAAVISTAPVPSSSSSSSTLTSTINLPSTITNTLVSPGPNEEISSITTTTIPCTTITYTSQITLPATYPTGPSQGSVIPSSSITSAMMTTITVPRVILQTMTITDESGIIVTTPALWYGGSSPSTTISDAVGTTSTMVMVTTNAWNSSSPSPATGVVVFDESSASVTQSSNGSLATLLPSSSVVMPYEGAGMRASFPAAAAGGGRGIIVVAVGWSVVVGMVGRAFVN